MAVVLVVVCERCRAEFRPERARGEWPARTRAAVHGWSTQQLRGVTLDVCPACAQGQVPAQQQPGERVLVGAASAARVSLAAPVVPVHAAVVSEAGVSLCRFCGDGEHLWCSGCDCAAH